MNLNDFSELNLDNKGIKKIYKYIIELSDEDVKKCEEEAKKRFELHKNHSSQTIFTEDSEFVGLVGECGFSKLKGVPMDWSKRISGDKYDFKIGDTYIDVKCTKNRPGVPVKLKVFRSYENFLYVMTRFYKSSNEVAIIGWIRGTEVNTKIKDQHYNKEDYFIPEDNFKDMDFFDNVVDEINKSLNKTNYYNYYKG